MGLRATRKLHDDAFQSMMRAPMSFFNLTPIGKTLNFFAKDQDDCDDVLHDNIYMVLSLSPLGHCSYFFMSSVTSQCCIPVLEVLTYWNPRRSAFT
jgi:hypothetical protein